MPIELPTRRRHRLPRAAYADVTAVCSVSIAVKDRRTLFSDASNARLACAVLTTHAVATGICVHAFCVMPDHVHLVVSPSDGCDILAFVGQWKNLVQRELWRCGVGGTVWQPGFWDRFLRTKQAIHEAILYVHANPVRAGLVVDARMYAFSSAHDADAVSG